MPYKLQILIYKLSVAIRHKLCFSLIETHFTFFLFNSYWIDKHKNEIHHGEALQIDDQSFKTNSVKPIGYWMLKYSWEWIFIAIPNAVFLRKSNLQCLVMEDEGDLFFLDKMFSYNYHLNDVFD